MNRLQNNITRLQVLWCGKAPSNEIASEFEERQLVLKPINKLDDLTPDLLPVSCGIVLDVAETPSQLKRFFKDFAVHTANNGLLHILVAKTTNEISRIRSLQPQFTKSIGRLTHKLAHDRKEFVRLIPKSNYEVPERLARWNPGPAKGTVEILGDVAAADRVFFERAFSDCRTIRVDRLTGGKSAIVYCVHATLLDSQIGSRPLPFFAKSDTLFKIQQERDKYFQFVNPYISFHLRPDLDEARCVRGAHRGMLVGDFVDQSESLRSVAARGHAQHAIYSLFENALAGLRLQAYPPQSVLPKLWDKMSKTFNPKRITRFPTRLEAVRRWSGLGDPAQVLSQLERLSDIPVLVAPIHGDLHAHNVRVRGFDAILIDFNSMRAQMPLSTDPASLEVSFVFGWGEESETAPPFEIWRNMVDRLYSREHVLQPPPPPDQANVREWFWSTVRQIRQIGMSSRIKSWEYGTVLAIHLLRYACFGNHFPPGHSKRAEDELRRSYAYFLGERLVGELIQHAESARQ